MENTSKALAVVPKEREYKGKISSKYWNEIDELHKNEVSYRKIAFMINEKYNESYNFQHVQSLVHFLNDGKKTSIETEFLDNVAGSVGLELQRVENLTQKFEQLIDDSFLQKDHRMLSLCSDRLIRLYQMKQANIVNAKQKDNPREENSQEKQQLLKQLLKKLNLENK